MITFEDNNKRKVVILSKAAWLCFNIFNLAKWGDRMDYIEKLKELTTYPAVSGYEKNLSQHIVGMFSKHCDTVQVDKFYNVIGYKSGKGDSKKKIMLTAHMDEIGFLVKSIDEKGFLKISNIGGIDPKILLAQEVIIHGQKELFGVIGAKPPHLLKPDETKKAVKLEDLRIDTGMTGDRIRELVSVGDLVTLKSTPLCLQGNKISSKAIDNRSGVIALLEIMKELVNINHSHDLYFVATAQEELELTGVITSAYSLEPDAAIVIDSCHGDMPDCPKEQTFPLGKGPAIGIGPNLHKKMTRKLIDIAKDENISYQIDVEPGDTGTEAWATQVSRVGIPTVLISIPVRYMHTTIETVNTGDIKNTARLAARFIGRIGAELEEILCY